jgi:hypothetical protein
LANFAKGSNSSSSSGSSDSAPPKNPAPLPTEKHK